MIDLRRKRLLVICEKFARLDMMPRSERWLLPRLRSIPYRNAGRKRP